MSRQTGTRAPDDQRCASLMPRRAGKRVEEPTGARESQTAEGLLRPQLHDIRAANRRPRDHPLPSRTPVEQPGFLRRCMTGLQGTQGVTAWAGGMAGGHQWKSLRRPWGRSNTLVLSWWIWVFDQQSTTRAGYACIVSFQATSAFAAFTSALPPGADILPPPPDFCFW